MNRKEFGGLAIAINNSLLETHSIISVIKEKDGQIGIKLKCNLNDVLIGVLGFYLSPDSYIYGQDPKSFFNDAASLWEDFCDCDLLIGSGDFIARISTEIDFLPDIDGDQCPVRSNPQSLPDHSILSGTFQASFFPLL